MSSTMSQPLPLRRKDRMPRIDQDYHGPSPGYGYGPSKYDAGYPPYVIQDKPPSSRRHQSEAPPPRRFREGRPQSERPSRRGPESTFTHDDPYGPPRRRGTADFPGEDPYRPRRSQSRREPGPRPARTFPFEPSGGRDSPPPYRPESQYDSRRSRPGRDAYLAGAVPPERHRRDRPMSMYGDESSGRRGSPPRDPRSVARGRPRDFDDEDFGRDRRHRSQGPQSRRSLPRRGRSPFSPRSSSSRDHPPQRRSSMPPTTKSKRRSSWWQNPMIQAGAQTAIAAGAQAAMKSRKDDGAWIGAKGAKVATAALGAALVDGFIGSKHPRSNKVMKQGVDAAAENIGKNGIDAFNITNAASGIGGSRRRRH